MPNPSLYVLGCDAELPPLVSGLIGMLRYARATTLDAVQGLTAADLDHRHDANSNSIGMLLAHIAAVEAWYQAATFDDRGWLPPNPLAGESPPISDLTPRRRSAAVPSTPICPISPRFASVRRGNSRRAGRSGF